MPQTKNAQAPKAEDAVGQFIRALRERRNLKLDELASSTGLTKGFLSKVERGLSSPPIATLMKIAQALDVSVSELFTGMPGSRQEPAVLTKSSQRDVIRRGKDRGYVYERLAVGSHFKLSPYIITLEEDAPDQTFEHMGEEVVHMIEGEVDYFVAGKIYRLEQGDTLVFDASKPHGPRKLKGKGAKFFAVFMERNQ